MAEAPAHANQHAEVRQTEKQEERRAQDEDSERRGRRRRMRVVAACDNSCEIVSFIVGAITITVILRVPTAIS